MKNCQAIKKNGAPCWANGAHIEVVWAKGAVAYPLSLVPNHVDETWESMPINVCGSHRKMLIERKPINISVVNLATANQPKEGIIMTNNTCEICNGTGYDADFDSPCGCPEKKVKTKVNGPTDNQKWRLAKEVAEVKAIMRLDITWATFAEDTTAKEAYDLVALVISVKEMIRMVKVKRTLLTAEQIEAIRAKINDKPTVAWVNAAKIKLAKLS